MQQEYIEISLSMELHLNFKKGNEIPLVEVKFPQRTPASDKMGSSPTL